MYPSSEDDYLLREQKVANKRQLDDVLPWALKQISQTTESAQARTWVDYSWPDSMSMIETDLIRADVRPCTRTAKELPNDVSGHS